MTSVILYGRHDSYGYNLPKRAAISLNCIAEVLTGPTDEILFVDYNTPVTLPTFIESIDDTLTSKAKDLISIIRVPPKIHAQFSDKTHLLTCEPLARNIAIRRSNPNNRWLLSTNTDMIFVIPPHQSLSLLVQDLKEGYHATPRYELPEALWECCDRKKPIQTIEQVSEWGLQFNLHHYLERDPAILFDAPGDFQLMSREHVFSIHGFDERMILGWHVDSNIAKRLFLKYGAPSSVREIVRAYHCMHTRVETKMHTHAVPRNDLKQFVENLTDWKIEQKNWGLPKEDFEIIKLNQSSARFYLGALEKLFPSDNLHTPFARRSHNLGLAQYPISHVAPYLINSIAYYAGKRKKIAYIGAHAFLHHSLQQVANILKASLTINPSSEEGPFDIMIFDFGFDLSQVDYNPKKIALIGLAFKKAALQSPTTFFFALNAKENAVQPFVATYINIKQLPASGCHLEGYPHHNQSQWKKDQQVSTKCFLDFFAEGDPCCYLHRPYKLGERLIFETALNNTGSLLDPNWHFTTKGAWTLGKKSSLKIPITHTSDALLSFTVRPNLHKRTCPEQTLQLSVNEEKIGTWKFSYPKWMPFNHCSAQEKISIRIPAQSSEYLTLTFHIDHPNGPHKKGVRIQSMVLNPL